MVEVAHTLDLSRLRVLEALKTSTLGAAQAGMKRCEELDKKLVEKGRQLAHARDALDQAGRHWSETVTEGLSIVHRVKRPGRREEWEERVIVFERECSDLESQIKDAQATQAADFERFNETSHLHDACKAFAAEYLRDGSDEQ